MNAQVGAFFQELGFELCQVYDKSLEYLFIVDDYLKEISTLPRIQTKEIIAEECKGNVRAYVDEKFLKESQVRNLLGSYFSDAEEFDLVDRYSKDYKNIYTLKIHDYLNIGYFIDSIVVEAYKNKFDFEKIRNYLNATLEYSLKIVEKQESCPPLDVSFSYSESGFAICVSLNAASVNFKKNLSLMKELSLKTNYFDLSYFQKRERLSLCALWFKESQLQSLRSYFLTEVSGKKIEVESSSTLINRLDEGAEETRYEPNVEVVDQSRKLQLARKFSLFIKNYREREESPVDLKSMTEKDIDTYLTHYPRQEALSELDSEIKNFIIKLLCDDSLYAGVTEYVQKVAQSNLDSSVDEIQKVLGEKSLEDISEIIKVRGNPIAETDDVTIVSGWSENLDEEAWKVKRSALIDQIKDEVTVIKSQGRNVVEDDIIKVVSSGLSANEEDVKTVVKGIVEEAVTKEWVFKADGSGIIKEEKTVVRSNDSEEDSSTAQRIGGHSRQSKLDETKRKLEEAYENSSEEDYAGSFLDKKKKKIEEAYAQSSEIEDEKKKQLEEAFAKSLEEHSSKKTPEEAPSINSEVDERKKKLEEAFAKSFEVNQAKNIQNGEQEKLESQLVRMKKVMDQMKAEMMRLRAVAEISKSVAEGHGDQSTEINDLKRTLIKSLETARNKEKMTTQLKENFDKIVQAKDERINSLESRIEELKEEYSKSEVYANEEKLEKLQVENKSLAARLELANRKINIISDNMNKQDSDAIVKKDKEIMTLKSNIQMAQSFMEKYKHERNEFESKLNEEREKLSKFRDEKSHTVAPVKDNEKDSEVSSLTNEKKGLEEKLKLQSLEIKKMEQKLKFTLAQLEDYQKKKNAPSSASATGPNSKGNDANVKKLEKATAQVAEANAEIADKKKDILKLKAENSLLNNKIAELERKLANAEKKAA